jgi:hypothetical protein
MASGQARAMESFRVAAAASPSSAAVAAASSLSSGPVSVSSYGSGGVAAARALEQLLAWEQTAPSNALADATAQLSKLTQHPHQHLSLLTHS